jgi:3-hydroxyisobutyrate dehydrogenase-like beta-hydroxyacid dehydrogenase
MAITSSTPTNPPYPAVAFIGLGAMGFAMSTHLVRTGFPVTGYDIYGPTLDRWRATCKEIASTTAPAKTATSPAETVRHASVVCLMVANHHHVHSALFDPQGGAVHALPPDVTVIIHATIPPTQPSNVRERLTREFGRPDVKLIDAPVSGGVARSINGTLTIMVSSDVMENLQDPSAKVVLENVASRGKTLYPIPGGLGAGQSAKALNQVQCGIHIPAASEIMGLAAVNGLDTQKFYDALTAKDPGAKPPVGWSWMFENRGPRMLSATPPMASATLIINKDVGIIRDEEVRLNVELPLLNTASDVITEVMKTHATADDSCIVQYYLGFGSDREGLVVKQAGNSSISASEQHSTTRDIAAAHALIHLVSAYETTRFAQALDLMRPEQKKQWFSIIAGAAGASTIFSEVIPRALEDADGIEAAFKKYAQEKFAGDAVEKATRLIEGAKKQGYVPVLLEAAVGNLKTLLG